MTQGPLPLILLAANEHPDEQFRVHLWACLDAWLETQSSTLAHDEIEAILARLIAKVIALISFTTGAPFIISWTPHILYTKKPFSR